MGSKIFLARPRINGLVTDRPLVGEARLEVRTDNTPEGTSVRVLDAGGVEHELLYVCAARRAGDRIVLELFAAGVDVEGPEAFDVDAEREDLPAILRAEGAIDAGPGGVRVTE